MTIARSPGQRAGLTRSAVLAAAHDLLVEKGAEAMTMRALARRLNVAPNTLYSHVENRTALLDEVLDELLASVVAPAPDTADPVAGLFDLISSSYVVLTAHPDLVPLYLARQGARGPHAVRLGHLVDALLTRAGVNTADIAEARRVLIVHAIGSAAFATSAPAEPGATRLVPGEDSRRTFSRSLRWLLAGLTGERPAGPGAAGAGRG
jgi:AcrR family transcriptional regulator